MSRRSRVLGQSRVISLFITLLAMLPAGLTTARADVTSWGWRRSLARSGLISAQAIATETHTSQPVLTSPAYTRPPSHVTEPAATTQTLADLKGRRALDTDRFDQNHPVLGPLLAEEAQLKAGDCLNVKTFNGLLPNNPYYNEARWRRSLDPVRFDRNQPNLGAVLAEDQRVRTLIATCLNAQQQGLTPPTEQPTGTPLGGGSSGGGGTPAVPEPTSLALLLLGAGALLAPRFANRLRARNRVEP